MNSYASIDVSYELIERIERQRKHLALVVTGAFIPAFLGLMVNAYLFLLYTHQKSPEHIFCFNIICFMSTDGGICRQKIYFIKKIQ